MLRREIGVTMNKRKITIVGGAGFVGSALARYFSKEFKVRVLDKNPLPKSLEEKVEYQQCDIRSYEKVEQGLKNTNLVIHAAIVQIPLINEAKRLGYEVNVLGTQNICKIVDKRPSIKGMILAGSWHLFGERGLEGVIDEGFGFRPDRVEDRARLYAFSKIAQETVVRFYDEISEKIYGIMRMGTVLGKGMPEKTAANLFITKGLKGEPLTPYKHSMYRPMLYVDINDVCGAFGAFAGKILRGEVQKGEGSLAHVVNLCYPEPITILDLATMIKDAITDHSGNKIIPEIKIVETGQPDLFTAKNKGLIKVNVRKAIEFLGMKKLKSPKESVERIVESRISKNNPHHED
jgi:UDP-glucose 4-epimerase